VAARFPGGSAASARPTAWRRLDAAVSVFGLLWPLMCSIRLSSSIGALASHRLHSTVSASDGALARMARPRAVSCMRPPASSASRPACTSSGQANAAIAWPG
jgi:hypothetical protein